MRTTPELFSHRPVAPLATSAGAKQFAPVSSQKLIAPTFPSTSTVRPPSAARCVAGMAGSMTIVPPNIPNELDEAKTTSSCTPMK